MTRPASSAETCYGTIVASLCGSRGVTVSSKRGFARGGLMVDGRLFAILRGPALLLKLPESRVATLIASGQGAPFDAGKGRPMREWVTVGLAASADWPFLAREALEFGKRRHV